MQVRDEFYPDIETKYEHLLTHMNDKNKLTDQLVKILKEICNLELFYSSSLDKFANSVSKLLIGKDPIKDILIILQRIIASKSQESDKLAREIKDDLIPSLLSSIDMTAQQQLKDKNNSIKQTRMNMQRKLRTLYAAQSRFKKSVNQVNKKTNYREKQSIMEHYRKQENLFSDTIDSYNSSIDNYMMKYSQICEQLSEIETKRKLTFRDGVNKVMILEMNYIKNIQYNLTRYVQSLNKMDGRLIIQDRIIGASQTAFYDSKDSGGVVQLAKLSNKNYIDHIGGRKKINPVLLAEEQKVFQLRVANPAGQLCDRVFHEMCETLLPILNFVVKTNHHNLLIEIVNFTKDIYIETEGLKITVLKSLLSHKVFSTDQFWSSYKRRVENKIQKQENSKNLGNNRKDRLQSLLERDINFLKLIQINQQLQSLLKEFQKFVHEKPDSNISSKQRNRSAQKVSDKFYALFK